MKHYRFEDFYNDEAWLIVRMDTQVQEQPVDIYFLLDLSSMKVIGHEIVESELDQQQADNLFKQGKAKNGVVPRRVILVKGDPAETFLCKSAENLGMDFESIPAPYLEELITPLKESFGQKFYSPSSFGYAITHDEDELDRETAKRMIPDSYDPCSCASGKKYKFCCKPVLREIIEAMATAEEGELSEALWWISKAKAIVGETAEVLCREAIVYSYLDTKKSEEILGKCLAINPNHPRAHYLRGLSLKAQGDFQGAIKAYEMAIANYPPSDHYHLNEAYTSLGTVFYHIGDMAKTKSAWEKALLFLPSDKTTRQNLTKLIYPNSHYH